MGYHKETLVASRSDLTVGARQLSLDFESELCLLRPAGPRRNGSLALMQGSSFPRSPS